MTTVTSQTKATRALVEYFNHELAEKLVNKVLAEKSETTWTKLSDSILALIPEAAKQAVWEQVVTFARTHSAKVVNSKPFQLKVDRFVNTNVDHWIKELVENEVKVLVRNHVSGVLKSSYDVSRHMKELPVRFRTMVDAEMANMVKSEIAKTLQKSA